MTGKRISALAVILIGLFYAASPQAQAQGNIYTKRAQIADFPTRTTKVVLSGDELLDTALREEVKSRWRISPFEFCEMEDFEAGKNRYGFYYLYISEDDSGLASLTLFKSGKGSSFFGKEGSVEVVSIPFCPSKLATGREFVFLPALIDIMQSYVEEAIMSEQKCLFGLSSYNGMLAKAKHKTIYVAGDDLSGSTMPKDSVYELAPGFVVTDDYTLDSLFTAGAEDALIAFCISPATHSKKARSYQLIVSANTHELYYINYHRFQKSGSRGFTPAEIRQIRKEHLYRKKK